MELSKKYNPKDVEEKWYQYWDENNFFQPKDDPNAPTYTIVIPPPNITGVLHMGHALNNTIQDVLIRFKRMQGFRTLWIPGTDHAGIATQNVVEKSLHKKNKKRTDYSQEEFINLVWEWKEKHGDTIIGQLKKLGCSCDWSRERFTMDERLSYAVFESFKRLYDKGLIYQGEYIINWCPRCRTALSDEEAEKQEQDGTLYTIRYPIVDSDECLVVATTRPETMLGDTAVAVNPKDKRYKKYIGKNIKLPLTDRVIPIIADEFVDPGFGTGAVKVTPAHDPNDFQMGKKHSLEFVVIMDEGAVMNKEAGKKYEGMDRFKCRKQVIQDLEEQALFVEKKPHRHAVGRCYRCETVVEPYISNQWFVKMEPLARAAIKVVEEGKIKFYPDRWTKVYLNWMTNIRDWCISRQIWWGHRIPVWTCKNCSHVMVETGEPDQCPECSKKGFSQDPDVLDTWFSSWLWPISTLGWPDQTEDLKTFYPTQTLSTAAEIIFFWVARMVMSGLEFTGEIPFSDVYIHGTVRDGHGKKMSKSLGNTVDPLHIIEKYSADALRFSMMAICAQGQDVYISEEKFELGRNFCNKLWNATRFTFMTMPIEKDEIQRAFQKQEHEFKDLADTHKWILSKLDKAVEEITKNLEAFRIGEAVQSLHELFWHHFCDWYLELIKVDRDHPRNKEVTYYVLTQILKLLHPIAPFITEEIWNKILPGTSIMNQAWPKADTCYRNPAIEEEFDLVQDVIRIIRNIRKDKGVAPSKSIRVLISTTKSSLTEHIRKYESYIVHLTKIEDLSIGENLEKPKDSVASVMKDLVIYVLMEGLIDLEKEKKRLTRQLQDLDRLIKQGSGKLENKEFLQKAPQDVIKRMRDRLTELHEQQKKVEEGLKILVT